LQHNGTPKKTVLLRQEIYGLSRADGYGGNAGGGMNGKRALINGAAVKGVLNAENVFSPAAHLPLNHHSNSGKPIIIVYHE
jgi:hypothetical protein